VAEDSERLKYYSIGRVREMKVASKKPRKKRKELYQAPSHVRRKHFSANLSPELREKHGARSVPVRMDDTVTIVRGDFTGMEGKVTKLDSKNYRIYVEGVTREKVDGSTVLVPIHPSKVEIKRLKLDDKWRKKILDRKMASKSVVLNTRKRRGK
jgi:large subunit ribosomal protein L24